MTATTTTAEIDRYQAAVRAALSDLSDEDRDDLMEDVASHLSDVAAEGLGPLDERLGKPADYAAELRSSAGLPVAGPPARQSWRTGISAALADSPYGRGLAAASDNRQVAAFRRFLVELRPGWWVLRGYLVAWLVGAVSGDASAGFLPRVRGSALLGLLLMLAAIWASVRLGRRWQARPPSRVWVVARSVGAVLLFLFAAVTGLSAGRSSDVGYVSPPAATINDGTLTNIYPFDGEGHPLSGVQLFDQDGRPIDVSGPILDSTGTEIMSVPRFDVAGTPVGNVFPRVPDNGAGQRAPFAPRRLAPPIAPSTAPSSGPSPSPSAQPSGVPSPSPR